MISVKLQESGQTANTYNETNLSERLVTPFQLTAQLDVTLDSGEINYLITENDADGLREMLATYEINLDNVRASKFVGMDSRALLCRETADSAIYAHNVTLTEAAKLLQGVLLDGVAVTQPEDERDRQTLLEVVERVLSVAQFDDAQQTAQKFVLTAEQNIRNILASVKSPQFKWNTQTTLWECLEQIGAVIDAIPQLYIDTAGELYVQFELVNATGNEADEIGDMWTNADGANVDESQYNTALGSVVENLKEED